MGSVLLARASGAEGFERLVALKRMNQDLLEADELRRRFVDEARVAAHVRHANVVAVNHFGRDDDGFYLVLDYVEGVSLQTLIDRAIELGIRPPPEIVLRVISDALAGLHAVHEATDATGRELGILHRDVSIQNVLIGADGMARLSDFGVAKSVIASQQTAENRLVGKLLYMPREYLLREPIGRTLDVYAMGMTLWIAFAGVEPWGDADDAQLVSKILHEGLPALGSTGVKVAPELEALVAKACARAPGDRYQTAAEMNRAIQELGRRTGWIADHADVSRFLLELCGKDIRRVREAVARVSSWPPARLSIPSSIPSSVPDNSRRWSAVGAQKIRVAPREASAAEAETQVAPAPSSSFPPRPSGVRRSSAREDEVVVDALDARRARARKAFLVVAGMVALLVAAVLGAAAVRWQL